MNQPGTARMMQWDFRHEYPRAVRGEGVYLWDQAGRRYLDGCAGALVVNYGHGRRELAERYARQAAELAFVHRSQFTSAPADELADRLVQLAPAGLTGVFLAGSGSEVADAALKLVRQYWFEQGQPGRYKVIGRWPGYHGSTLAALSMGGHAGRRVAFGPLLYDWPHFPVPYPGHCPRHPDQPGHPDQPACTADCAGALAEAIRQANPETVAAVILEPVVGSSLAALAPPDGYLHRVREICDQYGLLLIADEVMCGLGRTGAAFAVDHWGVAPDIITVGKGLSGGYAPLSALLCRGELLETLRRGSGKGIPGHTYSAHPAACAVGAGALDILADEGLIARSARMGDLLLAGLGELAVRHGLVTAVRGRGLMAGIELGGPDGRPPPPVRKLAARITAAAMAEGLLVYPGTGFRADGTGDQLLLGPPLTITATEVDELLELLGRSLARVEHDLATEGGLFT